MKTDNYLTLCLEQAAKSPLHYRHGLRRRRALDGGALKHGRIANGAFDGQAVADFKEKLKKQKHKPKPQNLRNKRKSDQDRLVPFEGTGGGPHQANVALSMHSEMMAIHSALASSATMSSSAAWCEKPCFKLSGSDKRKQRLRKQVLARFKGAILNLPHLNQVVHHRTPSHKKLQQEDVVVGADADVELPGRGSKERGRAFHDSLSGEKHQKKKGKKNQNEYQNEYQYDRDGQQAQQQQQQSAPKGSKLDEQHDKHDFKEQCATGLATEGGRASEKKKYQKDYKRSGKMRSFDAPEPAQPTPMLLPKGQAGDGPRSVADRQKHPRLNGADLYVARLGWVKESAKEAAASSNSPCTSSAAPESTSSPPLSRGTSSPTSSGSLYDELINREPSPGPAHSCSLEETPFGLDHVRASRPCYRCITYMRSVGVKRVFWTNSEGEWEGGKVRDLVDALDGSMDGIAQGGLGGPTGNGVFVTKHEVLMLKRMMGGKAAQS